MPRPTPAEFIVASAVLSRLEALGIANPRHSNPNYDVTNAQTRQIGIQIFNLKRVVKRHKNQKFLCCVLDPRFEGSTWSLVYLMMKTTN